MFDWLKNIVGGLTPIATVQGFPKTLTKADFNLARGSTQSIVAGVWNTIGEFVVPAQQKYRFGHGNPKEPDNQGYLYIDLKTDTNAQIEGIIRLVYSDASGLRKDVVFEDRTNRLRGSTVDRKLMIPLPEKIWTSRPDGYAREDDRLLIELRPDSNATLSYANSTVFIPATQVAPA
jgi:hypothetical protein